MDPDKTAQAESPSDGSDWSTRVVQLLEDWHRRVYCAQAGHYAAADHCRLLNYVVGVPAIVFSSVVGTAIFAGLEHESPGATSLGMTPRTMVVASISIAAAVLSALQTFLRFPERATQHATAADWYSAIRRDIEETLHLPIEFRGKAKECLDAIRKEMNRAAQDAPELNVRLWKREAKRFGVKEPLDVA